jgi:O-antigen/teichoic acid export membrane protein
MGIIIRQGLKSSVVTYIGVVIGMLNVLFLYNKFLTPEQLGLYATLTSFPLVFAGFAHLGTPHVGVRFFKHFANSERQHNGFLGYILITPLIGFSVFLTIYVLFKESLQKVYIQDSPLLIRYYWALPIITLCLMYQTVLDSYSKVQLRIVVPAIIREIFLKSSNSCLALLFGFRYITFDQLVMGIVIVNALAAVFQLIYIKILGQLFLKLDFSFTRKPIFKEMVQYGLWTMLGGATATIMPHLEKMMLPAYSGGLERTAIFNIALSIGLVITIPRNAIASISEPVLAESWKNKDLKNIGEIYRKSALNLSIIGIFLFLGIWCNIDSIFSIIPNSDIYQKGKFVVLMVGLYSIFDMATGLNSEMLRSSPYYRYDFSFNIIRLIIALSVNFILIPIYGYNGAAVAMLISVIVYNLVKFFFIKYKMGLQPFGIQTIKVIILGLSTYGLTILIPVFEGNIWMIFLNIALKSITILVIFGGGVLWLNVSEDLNKTVKKIWDLGFGNSD